MKWTVALLMLSGSLLAGCVSDDLDVGDDGEAPWADSGRYIPQENATDGLPPHYELPERPTTLTHVAFGDAPGGQGVWMWDDRAYVSTGSQGTWIFDISDPEHPVQIGNITGVAARDVDILNYGNRTVAVIASGGSYHFFDVTDAGEMILEDSLASFEGSGHNIAVHRPGHVVYNSRSLGTPPGGAEIIDARDPDDIKLHKTWDFERVAADGTPVANTGCHDVMIYPEQNRAYCPAVSQTLIWDVTDPLEPTVLHTIDNPLINIHHSAHTILDHSVLVIGDEYGGAAVYACFGHADTPAGDVSTPTGAIWFYDLTTPVPTLLSWLSPPPPQEFGNPESPINTCTAHFGSIIGEESSGYFSYGWYTVGALLVDGTDPMSPRLVDVYDSGGVVWDARYYRGYVFTGDSSHGLGVFKVV